MDETKARALLTELSALRKGEKPKVMPLILAFAAEIRRDERERAAAICDGHAKESEQRLAAMDQGVRACALWSRQSHEYDAKTIRALSDAIARANEHGETK